MAEKKAKKDKDAKKGKQATAAAGEGAMSIAAHPRAARRVAQAKGWGGLLGFLAGGYLSLSTHTLAEAGFRALVAGVVCYAIVWRGAVFLWRHLVVAELRTRQHELLQSELAKIGIPTHPHDQGARTQVGATS
jgi:predicted lipid-binding transport protein (Tim44 family)